MHPDNAIHAAAPAASDWTGVLVVLVLILTAVEVEHPLKGWVRLQARYSSRKLARGWYGFIRAAWHGLPLRTVEVKELVGEHDRGVIP